MERIISLMVGYCFGLIQTSFIIGKLNGFDIRREGSGNAGTTNAIRTMGWKPGLVTLASDMLKCVAAVFVVRYIYRGSEIVLLLALYASAGTILGHNFPFYLGFKGGKGVAATAGMIIAFGDIRLMVLALLCFFVPFLITHYVSLGSLVLSSGFLAGIIVLGNLSQLAVPANCLNEMYLLAACLTALTYWQHRANIKRLIAGNENKIF